MKPFLKRVLFADNHRVHYEVYGNPKGNPWIFCHGGPGYHCVPKSNLKYFDLKKDMVILFDQRGSGKSQPSSELKNNTTFHLVKDMERILESLKISKVNILGGSWGSTLALVFSLKNPSLVNALVLRGIFLGRKQDIWEIYKPKKTWSKEQKEKFELTLGYLQKKYKLKNILNDGFKIIQKRKGNNVQRAKAEDFAKRWAAYEDLLCDQGWKFFDFDSEYLKMAMDITAIEIFYFKNNCFLPTNYILKNAYKLKDHRITLVQGGEDIVCPPYQAKALHKAIKGSKLVIDPKGGHSTSKAMSLAMKKAVRQTGKIT